MAVQVDSGVSSMQSVCFDSSEISDTSSTLSVSDSDSTISDLRSTISNSSSTISDSNSTFSQNWADYKNMEEFLEKASLEEPSQNNVSQVTNDWILIYSEISLKGIGSDVSRWICVNDRNGRFVYQRRPTRRRAKDEKATFYKSIVLDQEGKIIEVM